MAKYIVVMNLKGGTGKTTSAVGIGQALIEQGCSVVGVDVDRENRSFVDWYRQAGFTWPVVSVDSAHLDREIPGIVGRRFDLVLIDTPPMRDHRHVVHAALQLADVAVIALAPSAIELRQLPKVTAFINNVAAERRRPITVRVLLTRVHARASSTDVYRQMLTTTYRLPVFSATIPEAERYRQADGQRFGKRLTRPYSSVATEILTLL